jgi:hypothetical protein
MVYVAVYIGPQQALSPFRTWNQSDWKIAIDRLIPFRWGNNKP